MVSKQATVRNAYGIHCRPAAVIAGEARDYEGTIRVRGDGEEVDVKSVLALVGLAAVCGQTLEITVDGPDEATVCERFVELFETNFDFER